jgi:hypothetical protein
MSLLTIELPVEEEAKLGSKANRAGIDLSTYVHRLIVADISRPDINEVLKPARDAFAASGMTEEELTEVILKAKKQMRIDRRTNETK